jgi:N-methylhydantoinase B
MATSTGQLSQTGLASAALSAGQLEILWSRLISFMDEAATTMVRTAYSTTIRESRDLTVVLFDRNGRALAECSTANPSFIGTLPRTLAAFLNRHSVETWQPGDLVITNDPWIGAGHLQDISMGSPVFARGELVGFTLIAAHGPDIGGTLYSALSREVFEEGLRIPICHYARCYERDLLVRDFITANVRVPEKVIGDLEGMAACVENAGNRVRELIEEISPEQFDFVADTIVARSRHAIEQSIAGLPDGIYTSTTTTSGLGSPLTIACAVTIAGSQLSVSFEGTSPNQPIGINVPLCYTHAHTVYPLKCLLAPDIPNNHGTLEPLSVSAPEGSLLNPKFPSPVAARHLTGQFLSAAVHMALKDILPDRVLAESGVTRPQLVFSGVTRDGKRFVEHMFMVGGLGARKGADGPNTICFPSNTTCTPIEIIESLTPLVIGLKEIVEDSGGAGTWRGGCGQRLAIRNGSDQPIQLSVLAELSHRGARGIFDGEPGRPCKIMIDGEAVADKTRTELKPGSMLVVESAGGGGYGAPGERTSERIDADRREGYQR